METEAESVVTTYEQQISYCGKPRCKKCREGIGHGPYWYAYRTVDGRTTRTYIGKNLPDEVAPSLLAPPIAQLRLFTLGRFRLERLVSGQWRSILDSAWKTCPDARLLLYYLISQPRRSAAKEQICMELWPDLERQTAELRLEQSQQMIDQLLSPGRSRHRFQPLHQQGDWLILAGQQHLWCDADALEELLGDSVHGVDDALSLYGGDFLPEQRFAPWTTPRRQQLRHTWTTLALLLTDRFLAHKETTQAINLLDDLLAGDPVNEAAVQRLLIALSQNSRRIEALRLYQRFVEALARDYGLAPTQETVAICETLRQGKQVHELPKQEEQTSVLPQGEAQESHLISEVRAHLTPLVGREKEHEQLTTLLHATASQLPARPQCVLLQGDAGLGKTRLAEEVSIQASQQGWMVIWSHAYAQESHIPYRLWIEALRKILKQSPWLRQEVRSQEHVYFPLTTLLPELQELFAPGVPFSAQITDLRMWEAVSSLIATTSESTPLLLVLDDVQWADRSSCNLLATFLRRSSAGRVLIVCTCRGQELRPTDHLVGVMADLQREHRIDVLPLSPLNDEQIATLVSEISPTDGDILEQIQACAAGNPLFAQELAQFAPAREEFKLASPPDRLLLTPLPTTIAGVLERRLLRLSPDGQHLVRKAAVIGARFSFKTLFALERASAGARAFSVDRILDLLEEAVQCGVLQERAAGSSITYQFWHPLLVSHLYEALSRARRASIHGHLATVLRETSGEQERELAATITYHLMQAHADDRLLVRYARLAAIRAHSLSAYSDAETYYSLATKHLQGDEQLHAELLEGRGECLRVQGRHEEARHCYEQALTIRLSNKGTDQLREAQIEAILACEIGQTCYDVGNYDQALGWYERGKHTLKTASVQAGPAVARVCLEQSYVAWRQGSYEAARPLAEQALALFAAVLQPSAPHVDHPEYMTRLQRTLSGDPTDLGRAYVLLGLIEVVAGSTTRAVSYLTHARDIYEQEDQLREIAIVCCDLGDLHARRAEYSQAQTVLQRSLQLAERIGDAPVTAFACGNLGILALRTEKFTEAEDLFQRAATLSEQLEDNASFSLWLTYVGEVQRECGTLTEARASLARALSLARKSHVAPYLGQALVAAANLHAASLLADATPTVPQKLHLLVRARLAVQRALRLDIEAETETVGHFTLAYIEWLEGERGQAVSHVQRTLEVAKQHEQMWLVAYGQRLLRSFQLAQGRDQEAHHFFEQAQTQTAL